MAVTLADLITSARVKTNTLGSGYFDDSVEMPLYANEAVSDVYDRIVAAYDAYFAQHAPFTLTSSNSILIADITAGAPVAPIAIGNWGEHVRDLTGTWYYTLGGHDNGSPVSAGYVPAAGTVTRFEVHPTANTQAVATVFQVRKNTIPTGITVTVPALSIAGQLDIAHTATFNGFDVLDIVAVVPGGEAGSTQMTFTANIVMQPAVATSPFYKELGVDYWPNGNAQTALTVLPIGSYLERNQGIGWGGPGIYGPIRRYNIIGDRLEILPAGTNYAGQYVLHYVPSPPVLTDVIDLPVEMERWKQLITLKMAKVMKEKREQPTDELQQDITLQERRIDEMAHHRTKEGKMIPRRGGGYRGGGNIGGFGFGNNGL